MAVRLPQQILRRSQTPGGREVEGGEGEGERQGEGARQEGEGGEAAAEGGPSERGGEGGGGGKDTAAAGGAQRGREGGAAPSHAVLLPSGAAPGIHAVHARTVRLQPRLRAQPPRVQRDALRHDAELPG